MLSPSLLLFVKYPEPGQVKSRLAHSVGDEKAAALYRRVVSENVKVALELSDAATPYVFFTPKEKEAEVRAWLGRGFSYCAQEGETLGARLAHAFEKVFSEGARAAAALGSDTLGLQKEVLEKAFASLTDHDLVLGPAEDGGYYLIALKKARPALFEAMPWSETGLLERTLSAAKELGLSVLQLPLLTDLDRVEDIPETWNHNSQGDPVCS